MPRTARAWRTSAATATGRRPAGRTAAPAGTAPGLLVARFVGIIAAASPGRPTLTAPTGGPLDAQRPNGPRDTAEQRPVIWHTISRASTMGGWR
ncbi:hypothetical protein GCM10009738_77290 [Kitasatospora viridis]